ncbi:MAG: hypothetical protein ABSG75_07545 [Syntrophales bacterium]
MTLPLVSARCRFESFASTQDKLREKSGADLFTPVPVPIIVIAKLVVKYKGSVDGKSMGRNGS